eukprot:gene27030-32663_t
MSEAALAKIQKDCAKLESELAVYKSAQPISASCEAIIGFINQQAEPLHQNKAGGAPNPWHSSAGGGGGCVVC